MGVARDWLGRWDGRPGCGVILPILDAHDSTMTAFGWLGHKADLSALGIDDAFLHWPMLGAQFTLAVIIHGFQFFAVFAMFPIALFLIMELSGYFVLLTTGTFSISYTQAYVTKSATLQRNSRCGSPNSQAPRRALPWSLLPRSTRPGGGLRMQRSRPLCATALSQLACYLRGQRLMNRIS